MSSQLTPARNVPASALGTLLACLAGNGMLCAAEANPPLDQEGQGASSQHALIGIKTTKENFQRTTHPDVQWLGEAGLGLFVTWFDGQPNVMSMDEIRQLQPGIVVNRRRHGYGDFATPECSVPNERIEGWWELCDTWAGGWGYSRSHENYNSNGWMLERLTKVRGWGGNYLVNAAPRADGTLPESCYERTKELTGWMKHSAVSVFDVVPGPFPARCNVPVTVKDHTWFAHLATSFRKPVVITGVERPERVSLLRTKGTLNAEYKDRTLTIAVPPEQRTELVDVVQIQWP